MTKKGDEPPLDFMGSNLDPSDRSKPLEEITFHYLICTVKFLFRGKEIFKMAFRKIIVYSQTKLNFYQRKYF